MDKLKNIIRETNDVSKAIKGENEVYWYNVRNQCFGFNDQEEIDLRNGGDHKDGEMRLSWCTFSKYGGWRIGKKKGL